MSKERLKQALSNWQAKLADYEYELSVTASTEQKFELQNRIEECQREIKRLEGTLNLSLKSGWVLRKDLKGQE